MAKPEQQRPGRQRQQQAAPRHNGRFRQSRAVAVAADIAGLPPAQDDAQEQQRGQQQRPNVAAAAPGPASGRGAEQPPRRRIAPAGPDTGPQPIAEQAAANPVEQAAERQR